MTLKLNTTEFTNESSVGVTILKYLLEQERDGKCVHFDTLKDHFEGTFSRSSLSDCIHKLAEGLIIEGTFVKVPEENDKVSYCFTIYPQYVPTVAQWIDGNYVTLDDFINNDNS